MCLASRSFTEVSAPNEESVLQAVDILRLCLGIQFGQDIIERLRNILTSLLLEDRRYVRVQESKLVCCALVDRDRIQVVGEVVDAILPDGPNTNRAKLKF